MISASLCDEVPWDRGYRYIYLPDWVMEQKLDGHRVMLQLHGYTVKPFNRNGEPYSRPVPVRLPFPVSGVWVLDGELVNGTYFAFDIPVANGRVVDMPLEQRRPLLERFVNHIQPTDTVVVLQASTTKEKHALMERVALMGLEGVVIKRKDATYTAAGWLKAKHYRTIDVVVSATRIDGKENASLVVWDGKDFVEIGHCSLLGASRSEVKPGDVVEVRYLYLGANNRLYQPVLERVRLDKKPLECTIDQAFKVNKGVLEALE